MELRHRNPQGGRLSASLQKEWTKNVENIFQGFLDQHDIDPKNEDEDDIQLIKERFVVDMQKALNTACAQALSRVSAYTATHVGPRVSG